MAKCARQTYFQRRQTTDDDLAAGVSALMHDIPGKEITDKPSKAKRRKNRKRRSKRTARKAKANVER
jgi:hypothetical protein